MSKVSSTRKLVSASALMASGTLVSRVLGLVRVMLIAVILGNGTRQADMLALATTVPNSLYILFAGGALNTVLVPQIVRAIKNDDDGGEAYTNRIMTAFMLIVAAVAVLVTLGAPLIMALYSSEGWRAPELAAQYASMVALAYLTLPQIFFYGAFFLLGQVLNARDKFGPMMWAPIANNVISILVLGVYLVVWGTGGDRSGAFTTAQILVLGIGSTVGIAAQSLVLLPYLKKVGFRFRPRFDLKGTGLGKTFSLTKWTIGFVAVNQLALLVVTRLATSATAGGAGSGYNVYSNAHLIWILPHSLITVSLATAMLPNASRLASAGNLRGVAQEATQTMRLALIVLIPAAVGFFTLAEPIASLFFAHGQGSTDASWVAWALMGFAVGLVPFTVQFICLRTYYALEDTRTPFLLQCAIAGANALLAVLLVWWVEDAGLVAAALALAYSAAYLVGVFISWRFLARKVPALNGRLVVMHVVRLTLGAAIGGVAAWFGSRLVAGLLGGGVLGNALAIVGGLLVIGVCHVGIAKALRVREFRDLSALVGTVLRRKGRKAVAPADPLTDDADDDRPAGRRRTTAAPRAVAMDDRDEYSAGAIAGGLTEDLMPTQLTPVVRDDLDPDLLDGAPGAESPATRDEDQDTFRRPLAEPVDDESLVDTQARPGAAIPAVGPVPPSAFPVGAPGEAVAPVAGPAVDDDDEHDDVNDHADEDEDTAPTHLAPLGRPGMLLSTRYRLEEELADRGWIATWRAHDLVLSRDVVTHVMRAGDPRLHDVIDSARTAAVATDSRFLRVLDAVVVEEEDGSGLGAYVVCEHTAGRSLTQVLGFGPLSTLESAWIVRELADALVGMHSQGLFHEHLTPDNVMVTSNGDVRLVGFGVESAIATDDRSELWSERESADVKGLAKLLYATLVQRWPGGPAHGLEAAPIIAGEPASPHIVRSGVSPALDRITTATLTERGAAAERRITTASQLAGALSEVLGTANASSDLEERVRLTTGPAPKRATPETVAYATPATPASPPATSVPSPAAPPTPARDEHDDLHDELHLGPTSPTSPVTVLEEERRRPGRPVLWLIVALVLGTFVVSLVMVAVNNARDTGSDPGTAETTSGPQTPGGTPTEGETGAHAIVGGADFDPAADGGNDEENHDQVPLAFDGDPATGWSTLRYHNRPTLGGLKPGVGIVLDLGEAKPVNAVELTFAAPGSTVEIRVPAQEDATEAPMGSEADWTVVAAQADAPASVTLAPDAATTTRFVLVYLTSLPEVSEARYLAQLNEVVVR